MTEFGVAITRLNQFFYHDLTTETETNAADYEKLEAFKADSDRVDNLEKQKSEEDLEPIFDSIRVSREWRETSKALVQSKGADFETKELDGKLKDLGSDLSEEYNAKAIINATGLGAKELVDDTDVYPVHGAIKRISNDNTNRFEAINEAHLVPAQMGDDKEPTKVVFLVPRNDETLIVGSIIERNNNQLNFQETSPEAEVMWDRACSFMPGLDDASTVPWYPLARASARSRRRM